MACQGFLVSSTGCTGNIEYRTLSGSPNLSAYDIIQRALWGLPRSRPHSGGALSHVQSSCALCQWLRAGYWL